MISGGKRRRRSRDRRVCIPALCRGGVNVTMPSPPTGREREGAGSTPAASTIAKKSNRALGQGSPGRFPQSPESVRKVWPGGRGKRAFTGQRGGSVAHYPTELLSGAMTCGSCGAAIAKVSGKSGGVRLGDAKDSSYSFVEDGVP